MHCQAHLPVAIHTLLIHAVPVAFGIFDDAACQMDRGEKQNPLPFIDQGQILMHEFQPLEGLRLKANILLGELKISEKRLAGKSAS